MTIDIAENLLENALEFTRRAAKDLVSSDYKFSIIHFCSAIEQILKARLILEHWMLVIDKGKIDKATFEQFSKGSLRTIPIKSLLLRSINLFENVDESYKECLDELFDERNKVIHFYKADIAQKEEQKRIVQLIYKSWYLTHNIIDNTEKFKQYNIKFDLINGEMKRFDEYLSVIFNENKDLIERLKNKGNDIINCEACGYKSLQGTDSQNSIKKGKCLVCDHREYYAKISCDSCCQINYLFHSNLLNWELTCSNEGCESELSWESREVVSGLGDFSGDPKHGAEYASCSECEHQHCVGEITKDSLICADCLCEHDSLFQCECCGELITRYIEDSCILGCDFCFGIGG